MRRKLAVAIGVVVVLVAVLVAWRTCGKSAGGERSATRAGEHGARDSDPATARGKSRQPKPPPSPASLSGRVTEARSGNGIPGAVVSIAPAELLSMVFRSESPTVTAITDANGKWEARVNPGAFVVAATAKGFLPNTRAKVKVTVAGGETRAGVDIALDAGGTLVKGTVTDVLGGPIGDARITIMERARPDLSGMASFVAVSKADGTYEITLPDGSFSGTASHDDYTDDSSSIVVAGKPLTVDFELIPGSTIRGQVVMRANNQPVPGALVRAEAGRGGDSIVRSDASGNFAIKSLGPGTIELFALGPGAASTNPTEVAVGIGETVDGVRVFVDRAYSISGTVVKKGKQEPIQGVILGAFSIAAKSLGIALEPSDADGAFEIVGMKPASYMLGAVGEGSVPELGQTVEIVDRDVTGVVVELASGVTLSGRVEPPIANVEMTLEMAGQIGLANMFEAAKTFLVRSVTDENGTFQLKNVPVGSFHVVANAPEGDQGKLAVTVADTDQGSLVVRLDARAKISGRVIDTSGAPVGGAQVRADPVKTDNARPSGFSFNDSGTTTVSAADGTWRIVGVQPGKVTLTASIDRGEMWMMRMNKDKKPLEIEVFAGREKTGVTLTVEARDGVIRGTVIGPDKQPAADAWVTAHFKSADDDEQMRQLRRWTGTTPVLTGADGRFEIKKLKKGTYDLDIEGPRGATRGEKPGVKTGDTVTIHLASLGTIAGKVTVDGKPVTDYLIECDGPKSDKSQWVQAADGGFKLERLAPGTYECSVDSAAGFAKEKVEVPAGPVARDFALAKWASITGVVVNVLTKQPVSGVYAIAGGRNVADILSGRAPATDRTGKFVLDRVAPGTGELAIQGKDSFEPAAKRPYTVVAAQRLDLGTIEIVAPRTGEAGTYGFATTEAADHLLVSAVTAEPALGAGIKEGDKITALNGMPVAQLTPPIAKLVLSSGTVGVGQPVKLTIDRAGTPVEVMLVSVRW